MNTFEICRGLLRLSGPARAVVYAPACPLPRSLAFALGRAATLPALVRYRAGPAHARGLLVSARLQRPLPPGPLPTRWAGRVSPAQLGRAWLTGRAQLLGRRAVLGHARACGPSLAAQVLSC